MDTALLADSAATTRAPAAKPAAASAAARAPLRVLVADDNVDTAESLSVLLVLHGHEAAIAHDGQATLELAERFRPHVALLDIGMPRVNGLDVARRIREQP